MRIVSLLLKCIIVGVVGSVILVAVMSFIGVSVSVVKFVLLVMKWGGLGCGLRVNCVC